MPNIGFNLKVIGQPKRSVQTMAEGASAALMEEPVPVLKLVSYLRDIVPHLIGGSESDLSNALAEEANTALLSKSAMLVSNHNSV
jgi:hypothetical protein